MEGILSLLIATWDVVLTKFSHPTSRVYWVYILLMPLVAMLPYFIYHKKIDTKFDVFAYLKFLFPKREYFDRSALLDYQFFLLNILLNPVRVVGFFVTPVVGVSLFHELNRLHPPTWDRLNVETSPLAALGFVVIFFLFNDFMDFLHHYARHKIPLLWSFHRVHHSAEVLNPMTLYRAHPVDLIFENAIFVFSMSIVIGVLSYFSVENLSVYFLAKIKVAIYVFNLLGNFRHSHVWIPFGPFWSKIFMSPAQHLIHHSVAPEHRDKNNGRMLSIWDWMFGSLYIPLDHERHDLVLGIDAGELNCHPNLLVALVDPFRKIFAPGSPGNGQQGSRGY